MKTNSPHPSWLLAGLVSAAITASASAQITWHTDLTGARALAGERGAPLFVTFRCER